MGSNYYHRAKKFEILVGQEEGRKGESSDKESEVEEAEVTRQTKRKLGKNRKLFKKLRQIHRQLCHPCQEMWSKMLKDAGLWTKDISMIITKIHERCNICKPIDKEYINGDRVYYILEAREGITGESGKRHRLRGSMHKHRPRMERSQTTWRKKGLDQTMQRLVTLIIIVHLSTNMTTCYEN